MINTINYLFLLLIQPHHSRFKLIICSQDNVFLWKISIPATMSQGGLLEISVGRGVSKARIIMHQNWSFQREGWGQGGGGGVSNQSVGEVWIFLEQPNLPFKTGERLRLRWLGRVLRLQQPCHSTYANRCQCLQTRAHLTTVFLDRNWKIERIISSDNDIQ